MRLSPETHTAADLIRLLDLKPLKHEGGYFRRTAESSLRVPLAPLPPLNRARADDRGGNSAERRAYSAIYALFTPEGFSALHRLGTDEIWCFHAGDPLECLRLHEDGRGERVTLGLDLRAGNRPQDVVPAGAWQGAQLAAGGRWALVSCIVAPEFSWDDFALGERVSLAAAYPEFHVTIAELTRET